MSDSNNSCPICQESLHCEITVGCTAPCGHLFHRRCFETWRLHCSQKNSKMGNCPTCNAPLTGFVDKIHIDLSPSPSISLASTTGREVEQLSLRKKLSNQKAVRSAMMRHSDRRRPKGEDLSCCDETVQTGNSGDSKRSRAVASATNMHSPSTSLSAVLRRIPEDPVKCKNINVDFYKALTAHNDSEEDNCSIKSRPLLSNEYITFSTLDDLEDEIPNVAEQIMRNIKMSIQPPSRKPSSAPYPIIPKEQEQSIKKWESPQEHRVSLYPVIPKEQEQPIKKWEPPQKQRVSFIF